MKRLTTDSPSSNFEALLNFVYGKDGWAYIRDGGDDVEVPLTQWAKTECLRHGCDEFSAQTPEDIDMEVGDCIMDFPDCPIALAYTFASQAVHLRSRLKIYEDILFDSDGKELVTLDQLRELAAPLSNDPLTLEDLRRMSGEAVWVVTDRLKEWCIVHSYHSDDVVGGGIIMTRRTAEKRTYQYNDYGNIWLAYRRKPEGADE